MSDVAKCLITARDPAAANDLGEILPRLIMQPSLNVRVLAQNPAWKILERKLSELGGLYKYDIQEVKGQDDVAIEAELNQTLTEFYPDLLISGVSGPDYGIDEIALRRCNDVGNIKTFAVQSYWGDINPVLGSVAQTVFVLDHFAAELTEKRYPEIKTIITGSFRNKKYKSFDVVNARHNFREKMQLYDSSTVIAFFGQPLFSYSWYRDTLRIFSLSLKKEFSSLEVFYKPHPKELQDAIEFTSELLSESGSKFYLLDDSDVFSLLAGSDLNVSLFSSIGYELQRMLACSPEGFSVPMYLFYEEGCRQFYTGYSGLESIAMAHDDMAIVVECPSALPDMIRLGLDRDFRNISHKKIRKNF